jgi:hypothetical protein
MFLFLFFMTLITVDEIPSRIALLMRCLGSWFYEMREIFLLFNFWIRLFFNHNLFHFLLIGLDFLCFLWSLSLSYHIWYIDVVIIFIIGKLRFSHCVYHLLKFSSLSPLSLLLSFLHHVWNPILDCRLLLGLFLRSLRPRLRILWWTWRYLLS